MVMLLPLTSVFNYLYKRGSTTWKKKIACFGNFVDSAVVTTGGIKQFLVNLFGVFTALLVSGFS